MGRSTSDAVPGHAGEEKGPLRASEVGPDDRYEVSNGYPVYCAPSGGRGSGANLTGGEVLGTDPAVSSAGVDTGYSPSPETLRAPDVAVGNVPDEPGWVPGVPLLALEYADTGQDEADLRRKVGELLAAGTRVVWVARLVGPRRVEVYERDRPMQVVPEEGELSAPGILRNPVPVRALFDRETAHAVALRNLLQRRGYDSLEAIRAEGEARGRAEGEARGRAEEARAALLRVLRRRGLAPSRAQEERIARETELAKLQAWLDATVTAASLDDVLG